MKLIELSINYDVPDRIAIQRLEERPIKDVYKQIQDELDSYGITTPIATYALGVPDCDDRICFHPDGKYWVTYYAERGMRFGLCLSINERDAAAAFIAAVKQAKNIVPCPVQPSN